MLLQPVVLVHVGSSIQASGRGDNDESLGTKQLSSITHPSVSVLGEILGAAIWLVIRQSGFESGPCENRASLEAAFFSIDMPFTNMVDCISSMLRGIEPTIYLAEKLFCFLNGAKTKKVRSAVKTQISMAYIFVPICMFSGNTYSFICRSLPVLCTRIYFLSIVSAAITQTWHFK